MESLKISLPSKIETRLLQALLWSNAIQVTPDPRLYFEWSPEIRTPVSINPKRLFATPHDREILAKCFASFAMQLRTSFDYIYGATIPGIVHSQSVGPVVHRPTIMRINQDFYEYGPHLFGKTPPPNKDGKCVIAISKSAIPYAMQYANMHKKAFACMAYDWKDPDRKLIIGHLLPQTRVILVYRDCAPKEVEDAERTLRENLISHICRFDVSPWRSHRKIAAKDLKGKTAVMISDSFTTAERLGEDLTFLRGTGAICEHNISVFSYDFEAPKKNLRGCLNLALVHFASLHQYLCVKNAFSESQLLTMWLEIKRIDTLLRSL